MLLDELKILQAKTNNMLEDATEWEDIVGIEKEYQQQYKAFVNNLENAKRCIDNLMAEVEKEVECGGN